MLFEIKAGAGVVTTSGARRRKVYGQTLIFTAAPVYLECDELPDVLATDKHLRVKEVDAAPEGAPIIRLKAERVQEDSTDPGPITNLKAERVQEDSTDPTDPSAAPVTTLKAERVQEPAAAKAKTRKR
jgi:hypothetical protein